MTSQGSIVDSWCVRNAQVLRHHHHTLIIEGFSYYFPCLGKKFDQATDGNPRYVHDSLCVKD